MGRVPYDGFSEVDGMPALCAGTDKKNGRSRPAQYVATAVDHAELASVQVVFGKGVFLDSSCAALYL